MPNPAARHAEVLAALVDIGLRMAARAEVTTGMPTPEQAEVQATLQRMIRRTVAVQARLYADSIKTPEQRAAEQARRETFANWLRMREKRAQVRLQVTDAIAAVPGPSDRENLVNDLHERLLQPDIPEALTQIEVGEMVQRVCHDIGITPKRETWSDALVASKVGIAHAEMTQAAAERAAWQAKVAAGADWRAGVEFSPPPGEIRKIGRFTCGPSGAVIAEEPMEIDPPQSAWAPDILGRALPDFTLKKKPPDTG